jgi:hypothetical protein
MFNAMDPKMAGSIRPNLKLHALKPDYWPEEQGPG